eukprot:TRINITY_DN3749_c1_g3_i2.p1 TRINITY_DN3749_c1_g3~~TRINITY_DN3749_c1_g3_i2.p1  ORF type:complete len:210 (+),score=105.96 TRINITY_DN3749_c1_g3_i2:55-684(+)
MPKQAKAGANAKLAEAFMELAVLEQKAGANGFVTNAYKKVATTLSGMKKEVKDVKDVKGVKGIGKGSIDRIREFLEDGTFARLEELREEYGVAGQSVAGAAKAKTKPPTKAVLAKIKKAAKEASSSTVADLKDELKRNSQSSTGVKAELAQRVGEGRVLGAIPVCEVCCLAKPKYDLKTGAYICKGGFDDDKYVSCVFEGDVTRVDWVE